MAEIAGALIGGLGALAQYSAAQQQQQIELAQLQFQKNMALQQQRMSQAARTDAYGNTQRYNAATNTWETDLTPTQKDIVGAGEQEQLQRLTTDAVRNRQILEEQRQRGLEAIPDYNKALAGFRYDQPASQAADADKLFTLLSLQNQDQVGADRQQIGRQLLRQGRGQDFATFVKSMDDKQARNIGSNLAQAYEASIPQYQQDVQMHQSKYLPVLAQLQQTMAGGMSSAPSPFSTVPQELSNMEQQQAQQMQAANASAASQVGNAYNAYAQSVGQTYPNLSGVASALGQMGKKSSSQPQYGLVPDSNAGATDPGVGYANMQIFQPAAMGGTGAFDPNMGTGDSMMTMPDFTGF